MSIIALGIPGIDIIRRGIAAYPQAAIDAMDLLTEHLGWKDPTYVMAGFMELVDNYHDGQELDLHQHAWATEKLTTGRLFELMEVLQVEAALDGWRWPESYALPAEVTTEANPTFGMF